MVHNFNIKKITQEDEKKYSSKEHRYASWRYCYNYFDKNVINKDNYDEDYAALMLGFYLASWGMYRGSSKLLTEYTYIIHKEAVKIIKSNAKLQECHDELLKYYESKGVSATDTLLTKILLGTRGNCPAYDRFFKSGISLFNDKYNTKISQTFSEVNYENMLDILGGKCKDIGDLQYTQKYPIAKIIDMYFFNLGINKDII